MKTTVNFSKFCDSFSEDRRDTFSYNGKKAIFEYLEQIEEETGTDIELDIVALCCEFTEYSDVQEAYEVYKEDFDDLGKNHQEKYNQAMEYLRDNTQVIEFGGGIIIQDF